MLILLILIIIYIVYKCNNKVIEEFQWTKREDCLYKTNKTLLDVMEKYNITKGDLKDYDLFLPCSYNNIPLEEKYIPEEKDKKIFVLRTCNILTNKLTLWNIVYNKYGLSEAKRIMPETYIIKELLNENSNDYIRYIKNYKKDKPYILKKNVQRQNGLKIVSNINNFSKYQNYVIMQDLLQNPFLIDKRKINLRIYLLIMLKDNKLSAYVHNNGFLYYTATEFNKDLRDETNITTGYVDRSVYEKNPLTLKDLRKYLSDNKIKHSLFDKINILLRKVVISYRDIIDTNSENKLFFQLFGADIFVNNNLEPLLMEINKGPDLGYKDERDKQVKIKVVTDIFTLIGLTDENSVDFLKIL